MPAPDGSDDFVWVLGPLEGPWAVVGLCKVAFDGGLQSDQRMEDTALQALLGQLGEEPLDGIEPRRRGWREVEGETRMPAQPLHDLGVLVGGVVVEDEVDRLALRDCGFDRVEEADELLMPMTLHAAADHLALRHIQRGEQRRPMYGFNKGGSIVDRALMLVSR